MEIEVQCKKRSQYSKAEDQNYSSDFCWLEWLVDKIVVLSPPLPPSPHQVGVDRAASLFRVELSLHHLVEEPSGLDGE